MSKRHRARLRLIGQPVPQSGAVDISKLASRFPNPTNAVALAALEGVQQWTNADAAKKIGVDALTADSFLEPDGILTRMRALACGWTKPGDKMRLPTDTAWWNKAYAFPLWNPLTTYVTNISKVPSVGTDVFFDEDIARADSAALSTALGGMNAEITELLEAPCPRWIIPPGRGQMPIANPECAKKDKERLDRERAIERDQRQKANKSEAWDWILFLGIGALVYFAGKRRFFS